MRQMLLDRANDSGIARIGEETKRHTGTPGRLLPARRSMTSCWAADTATSTEPAVSVRMVTGMLRADQPEARASPPASELTCAAIHR